MSVYFVQVGDHIKIGHSDNPQRRADNLFASATRYSAPTGTPTTRAARRLLRVIDGTVATERAIHAALDDYRVQGEWFADEPEVRDFIATAETAPTYPRIIRATGPVERTSSLTADDHAALDAALGRMFAA